MLLEELVKQQARLLEKLGLIWFGYVWMLKSTISLFSPELGPQA